MKSQEETLKELRDQMDLVNLDILLALQKRFDLLDEISLTKKKLRLENYDDKRTKEMHKKVISNCKRNDLKERMGRIFFEIFEQSLDYLETGVK